MNSFLVILKESTQCDLLTLLLQNRKTNCCEFVHAQLNAELKPSNSNIFPVVTVLKLPQRHISQDEV